MKRTSIGLLVIMLSVLLLQACASSAPGVSEVAASVSSTETGEISPGDSEEGSDTASGSPTPQASQEAEGLPTLDSVATSTQMSSVTEEPKVVDWKEMPVIPQLSERALEIYFEGIERGNDPHAFSKVGDCQNVPSMFVSIFDYPGFYTLGEDNEYLTETIDWYRGSFNRESEAVRRGFNAASVVSPVWADPEVCEIGEDPLHCELRLHNPSVAIVSLETWWAGNPDNYEKYVRQILETLIEHGVLPILATKADNLEGDHHINVILTSLALEYQIPLWNFWLAVQPLPNHGLMDDDFHLTFAPNEFDDPIVMQSAWPWRNLTALQVLDAVRVGIGNIE